MAFSTVLFLLIFLPLCIALFHVFHGASLIWPWVLRSRIEDVFLVLASLIFYSLGSLSSLGWFLSYIFLTYVIARSLKMLARGPRRGNVLAASLGIIALLAFLFFYKYFQSLTELTGGGAFLNFDFSALIAPLGISFITFSAISYVIDSYHSPDQAIDPLDLALYLSFFPKVVSGPIVLWRDFRRQLDDRAVTVDRTLQGIHRIIVGLAKKVILADTFGALIATIHGNLETGIDIPTAWATAFLYFLQIYYDFAGYSSMAIGLANLFGFDFAENFNFPYRATSITEFWRRWHISLGQWFREYLYIPLGGNRIGQTRTLLHLAVVFILTGIWHGAGPGYLLWGMLHGAVMILERLLKGRGVLAKIPPFVKWVFTMFIVMMGWLVFQFNSLEGAADFARIMFGVTRFSDMFASYRFYFTPRILALALIGLLGSTCLGSPFLRRVFDGSRASIGRFVISELFMAGLLLLSILFVVNSTFSPFIYFQY